VRYSRPNRRRGAEQGAVGGAAIFSWSLSHGEAVYVECSVSRGTPAIFITTDESGGLYDSGYIQTIDFFGDCPRIMLLLVSPYAKQGYVDHTKWRSRFVVEVPRKKTRALVPFRRQAAITFPIL
jgi:hypothetical protein